MRLLALLMSLSSSSAATTGKNPSLLRSSNPPLRKIQSFQRYPTRLIVNLDETPLPFEFLNGYTYEVQGKKTIAGKSERSGWGKRLATIILYIMANGNNPFKPVVIFHGKGTVASCHGRCYCTIAVTTIVPLYPRTHARLYTSSAIDPLYSKGDDKPHDLHNHSTKR
jgi:hypothetical protein